ncbi:MAG: substrate-binding domain-containing protein [Actinobacteria bacterium]|nr:substrate-binding domain-containing protein [Actinomycetota bacterium]
MAGASMIGRPKIVALALALLVAASCARDSSSAGGSGGDNGCRPVTVATSPEKLELLTALASEFNRSDAAASAAGEECAQVRVARKSSGAAADLLSEGWPENEANGPQPVIWSPAGSSWGAIVNHRLSVQGMEPFVPADPEPFMLTPLVIAMPRPMAQALGWPDTPIGYSDLLALARDPQGWASKGHPEWGQFKLGKTNPNYSTSALNATIAQYYAATGKQGDLTREDLARPEVEAFNRGVESAVVHYGDITMTFLNNWFRNDRRGTALTYVSAVAVEEKSVIDYNRGNPDGITDPGEEPKPPRVPLVAVYPKEGTLFSDNPLFVLEAPWVEPDEEEAAEKFAEFVRRPEAQRRTLEFGFRPGNPEVSTGAPIELANGVDPKQPQTTLRVPDPPILVEIIERWEQTRRGARVLLVIDVSGSMGEEAGPGQTKLDLAKAAAIEALEQFKAEDEVGLRIFSTDLRQAEPRDYIDLVPIGPVGAQREQIAAKIRDLTPVAGTPLYTVARASFEDMKQSFDPDRINAVVLLTDGRNEDPRNEDVESALRVLRAGSEGTSAAPVRVFTIAYGKDADAGTLRRLAEATDAATYDAADPSTIDNVFTAVISNF